MHVDLGPGLLFQERSKAKATSRMLDVKVILRLNSESYAKFTADKQRLCGLFIKYIHKNLPK